MGTIGDNCQMNQKQNVLQGSLSIPLTTSLFLSAVLVILSGHLY